MNVAAQTLGGSMCASHTYLIYLTVYCTHDVVRSRRLNLVKATRNASLYLRRSVSSASGRLSRSEYGQKVR